MNHPAALDPLALPLHGRQVIEASAGTGKTWTLSALYLRLVLGLRGQQGVWGIAADTDGIDGSENNAGAILTPDSLKRASSKHINAAKLLDNNDGHGFFHALDDLVVTGPTRTNVNDFRVILIL